MCKFEENYIIETAIAEPEPASMIQTFRAIGYSIETAVSDVIDNSITANARNIWIDFDWKGDETWFSIKDDGNGMNNDELIQAMKPGSTNPVEIRHKNDLGRFGLGLKTASFSQCRQLTVYSKKINYKSLCWTWDLDYVQKTGKWELIKLAPETLFSEQIEKLNTGTIVVWKKMDRVYKNSIKNDEKSLDKFLKIMEEIKKHLSIVFHRFIENKKIKIFFKERELTHWDPFLQSEFATQPLEEETLNNGEIKIKGYVLPHKSKIDEQKYKEAEGIKGWNGHQGFYIYRNERLILAGDWLGLFRKEEHYKLARISVDLPNSLDSEWQIDIKKSIARPPLVLKDRIKAYALMVRAQAVEVYRHRGKSITRLNGQQFISLWIPHKRGNKWFFKINREHPVISEVLEQSKTEPQKAFETLLRFIEETIPTKSIYIKESEEPELQGQPFEGIDIEPIKNLMQLMFENLILSGNSPETAKSLIGNIEPFNHYIQFVELLGIK